MKTLSMLPLLALPLFAGEMRDIASHDQLSQRLRASEQRDPMRNLAPAEGEDPTKAARPADLLATSEVLCFNGVATLVPKGSVLAIPANLKTRTGFQAGARIVPWQQFYLNNRNWLSTAEVSFEQAAGHEELPEGLRQKLEESRTIIIATMRQGPISVNPYEPTAEDAEPQTAAR